MKLILPPKFSSFRPGQEEAFHEIATHDKRWLLQIIPTGVGKSLIYIAGSQLRGGRTLILTSTKALQDQLMYDFAELGLKDIRGRNNYPCTKEAGLTAENGPCVNGYACRGRKEVGYCPFLDALREARVAKYVVTNYALWLHAGDLLGEVNNLIFDEAHAAPGHLSGFLGARLNLEEVDKHLNFNINKFRPEPRIQAEYHLKEVNQKLKNSPPKTKYKKLTELRRAFEKVLRATRSDYITEEQGKFFHVDPVDIKPFAEEYLFRGVDFGLLTSATATKKIPQMLGIATKTSEWPSPFPIENRPVLAVDVGVRVDHKLTQEGLYRWIEKIDHLIGDRLDRKGIIHSVSYNRARTIAKHSDHRGVFIDHGTRNIHQAIRSFRQLPPPKVLISPSVTTGYDFPGRECEYQILSKVPFPDLRSKVFQARREIDPDLPYHIAWQQIIQAAGRGMRSAGDRCETLITDNHFKWLLRRYKRLAPKWFLEAVQQTSTLPTPLDRLNN